MRLVPVLLIAAALAFAGCFGKSNDDNTNPTDTTPTTTSPTTTSPTGTTPTPTTSSGANTSTPTGPMAPKDVKSGNADFSNPAAPPAAVNIAIDPGYTTLSLYVNWTGSAGGAGVVAQDLTVKVGSLTCTLAAGPISPATAAAPCAKAGAATAGAAKVEFSGSGAATATYKIVES